ncbi:hypothetical protein L486_04465 [Kwoniella mangroviensis CBS 10435]|uniref:Uncharacterized protein n=1 Tax=Kwoniella mangroviensis CBS 10435 TaxID=1331196 RepID=A0A1B9ISB6_9TREE|nr:hypothetical protein L486_04465 [Kwoniella mangroviensis CBS 10435]
MRPYTTALLNHLGRCASWIAADIDTLVDLGNICQTVFLKNKIVPRHHSDNLRAYDLYVGERESLFFNQGGEIDIEISKYPHLSSNLLKYPQCQLDHKVDRFISVVAACAVIEFARRIGEARQEASRRGPEELPKLLWTWGGDRASAGGYMTNQPLLPESYYIYGVHKLSEVFHALTPAQKNFKFTQLKTVITGFKVYSSKRTTRTEFQVSMDWNATETPMNLILTFMKQVYCAGHPKSPFASSHRDLIPLEGKPLQFEALHTKKCQSYVIANMQHVASAIIPVTRGDSGFNDKKSKKDKKADDDGKFDEEKHQNEVGDVKKEQNAHGVMDDGSRARPGSKEGHVLQVQDVNAGPSHGGNVQKRNLKHVPAESNASAKKVKRNSKKEKDTGNVKLDAMNYFYKK